MLAIAARLAVKTTENRRPTLVTPGELYRILSAEFRAQRPPGCVCRMRMVTLRERKGIHAANWSLEPATRSCVRCEPLISRLIAQYAPLYDIRQPAE